MKSNLRKRSVTIGDHATSVALEPSFWDALEEMATLRKLSLAGLLKELDAERGDSLLASYCRCAALAHYKSKRKGKA